MKTDKIFALGRCVLVSAALGFSNPLLADDSPAAPPPPDAPPAPNPPPETFSQDAPPPAPRRKKVRVEQRGPGNSVRVEEKDRTDAGLDAFDSEDPKARKQLHLFADEAGEKHVFKFSPDGHEADIVIRKFGGPGGPEGPMLAARARTEAALGHLEEAIDHLRAAGLADLAARVQLRADQMRNQARASGELRQQVEELKREQEKLRREIKRLRQAEKGSKAEIQEKTESPEPGPGDKKPE